MEEDFVEKVEEIDNQVRRVSFSITNIPVGELKKFKEMCKVEYGDVYWVGLVQLMKIKEQYENFLPLLSKLLDNQHQKKIKKTFGGEDVKIE